MRPPPKRILLVSANGLGDCVAFLPVAAAVRTALPESHIAMMTRRAGAEAAELTGTVDEFIIVPSPGESPHADRTKEFCLTAFPLSHLLNLCCARKTEFFRMVRALRKERFDLALMASGERSSTAALLFLGGVRTRIGFADCRLRWLLSIRVAAHEPELECRRNLRLLSAAGIPEKLERPPCHVPASLRAEAESLLENVGAGKGRPRVLIHPGSSLPSRRWPVQNFAEICSRLLKTGMAQPVLVEGPSEPGLGEAIQRLASQPVPVLSHFSSIGLLAAVMSECDLFVGHSSGPLHLAFLVGLPSVSLWGDTDPKLWGPAWEEDRHAIVRSPLPCAGCERWDPKRHRVLRGPMGARTDSAPYGKCLEAIPVDQVLEAISRQLTRRA
jgi:ADP-heptose:LPS heptosyltransferase